MLGQKKPAPGPALEQHKFDGEADGDVATGRVGVPDERGRVGALGVMVPGRTSSPVVRTGSP